MTEVSNCFYATVGFTFVVDMMIKDWVQIV